MQPPTLDEFCRTFVQRHPRYAVKMPGHTWTTKNKALSDNPIKAHLAGKYAVATLGRWYPTYGIIDVDSKDLGFVNDTRSILGLDESSSMLCSSESKDSYHLIIRPLFNNVPPTLNLFQSIMGPFCRTRGIEIYPQVNRCIRLPFGLIQHCLDEGREHLVTWQEKLYWFNKLDDFDISTTPRSQMRLNLPEDTHKHNIILPPAEQGKLLFRNGLQRPSSRYESQYLVLYYLWRRNMPLDEAIQATCTWIRKCHNGYSKDIRTYPRRVYEEIKRQALHIYTKYDNTGMLPDDAHNNHEGYLTRPDMQEIIMYSDGSIPRAKFLFQAVRYFYPRRYRQTVNVHRDKLVSWSGTRTYQDYLAYFEEKGIMKRSNHYLVGEFSKPLSLNWKYRTSDEAVLYDGRSVDRFDHALKILFRPEDARVILRTAGVSNQAAYITVKRIYDP